MHTNDKDSNLHAKAVFLTGMTDMGNDLLHFYPNVKLNEHINHNLCLKTMPMACEDGDMMITHISDFLAVCVTRLIPNFEEDSFKQETFATLGLLIPKDVNPMPYYKMLTNLLTRLEKEGRLNKETLVESIPKIYTSINQKDKSSKLQTLPRFT